jgi:hypothetical protein
LGSILPITIHFARLVGKILTETGSGICRVLTFVLGGF